MSHWYHLHFMHTADSMPKSTLVIAYSQGEYFEDHLEEHHILSLFSSGDKMLYSDTLSIPLQPTPDVPVYESSDVAPDLMLTTITSNYKTCTTITYNCNY